MKSVYGVVGIILAVVVVSTWITSMDEAKTEFKQQMEQLDRQFEGPDPSLGRREPAPRAFAEPTPDMALPAGDPREPRPAGESKGLPPVVEARSARAIPRGESAPSARAPRELSLEEQYRQRVQAMRKASNEWMNEPMDQWGLERGR